MLREPSVLAGQDGSPDYLFQTNLVGAYQCLEKARAWGSKFIFLSTSRIYPSPGSKRIRGARRRRVLCGKITARPPFVTWRGRGFGFERRAFALRLHQTFRRATYRGNSCRLRPESVVNRCGVIAGPWQFGKVDQGVTSLWCWRIILAGLELYRLWRRRQAKSAMSCMWLTCAI